MMAPHPHNPWPATTTKGQLIAQMFTECTIMGWEYDITPEEHTIALSRLDALMAELAGRSLWLDYQFPVAMGHSSLADALGCPDAAFHALSVLGAERLCPTMGKTQARESRIALWNAMKALRAVAISMAPLMHFAPGTIRGSGNKPWATHAPWVDGRHRRPAPIGPDVHALGTENGGIIGTENGGIISIDDGVGQ